MQTANSTPERERTRLLTELESYIDRTSLADLLDIVSDVCLAKAEHHRENWQDDVAARGWEGAARKIAVLAAKRDYPYNAGSHTLDAGTRPW